MILLVDLCYQRDSLSSLEFVQPIKRIVGKEAQVVHFSKLNAKLIKKAAKIILCGTALKDNEFLKHKSKFSWLKTTKKPVLGICAGMQMIALVFGSKITKQKEIGMRTLSTKDTILGKDSLNVYELHGNGITLPKGFEVIAKNENIQAMRKDNIYGIVFHPEVRNHQIIKNFLNKNL